MTGTEVELATDDGGGALVPAGEHAVEVHAHEHPGPRQYVLIAIVLVTLTAVEVATSYIATDHTNLIIAVLAVFAFIKFFLVCAWYMHMKQDNPLFRTMFTGGILLAMMVYGILLLFFSSTVLKS